MWLSGANRSARLSWADWTERGKRAGRAAGRAGDSRTCLLYTSCSAKGYAREKEVTPERIAEYNAIFTELAQEKRVYLLDPAPLFTDENGDLRAELTDDGVHLNTAGFKIYQDYIKTHVEEGSNNEKMECIDPDSAVDRRLPEPGQAEREERGGSDGAVSYTHLDVYKRQDMALFK